MSAVSILTNALAILARMEQFAKTNLVAFLANARAVPLEILTELDVAKPNHLSLVQPPNLVLQENNVSQMNLLEIAFVFAYKDTPVIKKLVNVEISMSAWS